MDIWIGTGILPGPTPDRDGTGSPAGTSPASALTGGHRRVGREAHVLVLGGDLACDERGQLGDDDRIPRAVVEPASAQDAVFRGADQGIVGARERPGPVAQRHDVMDDVVAGAVGHDHDLDADLAGRIVQPEPAGLGQLGARFPRTRAAEAAIPSSSSSLPGVRVVRWISAIRWHPFTNRVHTRFAWRTCVHPIRFWPGL